MKKNANKKDEVSFSAIIEDTFCMIPSKKQLKRALKKYNEGRATEDDMFILNLYGCFCRITDRRDRTLIKKDSGGI